MRCLVTTIVFLLVFQAGCTGENDKKPSDRNTPVIKIENWQYRYGDSPRDEENSYTWIKDVRDTGWQKAPVTINPAGRAGNQFLWLRAQLPGPEIDKASLFIPRYMIKSYELYLESHLLSRSVNQPAKGDRAFKYFTWKIVDLPENYQGKYLYLRMHSDLINIGMIDNFLIGTPDHLVIDLVKNDLIFILFSFLIFILSLVSLVLFFFSPQNKIYIGFFLLSSLFSVFIISLSNTQQILLDNHGIWNWVSIFYAPVFTAGFVLFLGEIIPGRYAKILLFGFITVPFSIIISFILIWLDVLYLIYAPIPAFIVFLLYLPFVVYVLIKEFIRKNNDVRLLIAGLFFLMLFLLIDALRAIFCLATEVKQLIPVGVLLFLFPLGSILVRRYIKTYNELAAYTKEIAIARSIQESILPERHPGEVSYNIQATYVPMAEVGGDFYDFHVIDSGSMGILLADVSGHGVPAALISSMVKVAFSLQKENTADPQKMMSNMREILKGQVGSHFLTACYVYLDKNSGTLSVANAGHLPMFLYKMDKKETFLVNPKGRLIAALPDENFEYESHDFDSGDRIVLITDGIIEAINSRDELFGMERFIDLVNESSHLNPEEFSKMVLKKLSSWSKTGRKFDDDVTMIVIDS